MTSCIGWILNVSIDDDHATLWIKTEDGQILKLRDSYRPGFYILPRNEVDGLHLLQILSREEDIRVRWQEDKRTNLFDSSSRQRKLIYIQLRSLRYYRPLLKKLENDYRVKQLFNTDLLHVQQYLFTKLKIEPTSKVKVEYDGSKLLGLAKVDNEDDVNPPPFSMLYFDLHTYSGIISSEDGIRVIKVRYGEDEAVFDIQYIYTDSKHNNPLCRVTPIEKLDSLPPYDKEKYKEMILDAAETVLGFFRFDRMAYSNLKRGRRKWYEELREQRTRYIETEML